MRFAMIILCLTAIAITLVHLRRIETATTAQVQRLSARQLQLRRQLWSQQLQLGGLTSPDQTKKRVEQMSLELTDRAVNSEPDRHTGSSKAASD